MNKNGTTERGRKRVMNKNRKQNLKMRWWCITPLFASLIAAEAQSTSSLGLSKFLNSHFRMKLPKVDMMEKFTLETPENALEFIHLDYVSNHKSKQNKLRPSSRLRPSLSPINLLFLIWLIFAVA